MKKILIGALLLASMSAFAQETYENANIATEDLNGTARYVGMGGAMEALGADISTIGTNPAGIGMFRRSQFTLSAGFVSQANAASSKYTDGTKASFDQVGGVWSTNMGNHRYLNFGFNYHKSRNFNNILTAADNLSGASQSKLSVMKGYEGCYGLDWDDSNQEWDGTSNAFSQVDFLNVNALNLYNGTTDSYTFFDANHYDFKKASKGHVGEYDFNISGNVSDRVYLGLTLGLKDVHYDAYTEYTETIDGGAIDGGSVTMTDDHRITGSGFDIKAGIIFFPIENSAFRIGANIATPTWYDLSTYNYTTIRNDIDDELCPGGWDDGHIDENYDYRISTPWKFGVSLGHTIGKSLALGASYEYAGYTHLQTRVLDGGDGWGGTRSYKDDVMGEDTKANLKGVHTLKLGAEYKILPDLAVRVGYNFVSPMYKSDAYRDGSLDSPGTYFASTTDYTNWKATHRVTFGLGYSFGQFGIDFAYQYQTTKGEFAPFMSYTYNTDGTASEYDCIPNMYNVKNDRHQFLATLSYKF